MDFLAFNFTYILGQWTISNPDEVRGYECSTLRFTKVELVLLPPPHARDVSDENAFMCDEH